MNELRVFDGRVIFDHLPKTAGQAINKWLIETLGSACVTGNLIGAHRDLIGSHGGNYSIISAHLHFNREGLDPRYKYVTCLREPLDRVISWLYFIVKNHDLSESKELWQAAQSFLESEGSVIQPLLLDHIKNPYVNHFSSISQLSVEGDAEKLATALFAIEGYDLWGLYEALPDFVDDFSALLHLTTPKQLNRVNVTRERPASNQISPFFRANLEALLKLDIEFYTCLLARYRLSRQSMKRLAESVSLWRPFQRIERNFTMPEFVLISAERVEEESCVAGNIISFQLEFSLANESPELEIGIHIFDESGRWAFGTNTTMLDQRLFRVTAGTHRLHFAIVADLPEGGYTAGFAFAEPTIGRVRELAWFDAVLGFRISINRVIPSIGYLSLPVAMDCHQIDNNVKLPVFDARGNLHFKAALGDLLPSELVVLPVLLQNESSQDWISFVKNEIHLSFSWVDSLGNEIFTDEHKSSLPIPKLLAGQTLDLRMTIQAPNISGNYRLRVQPMQGSLYKFDEYGFIPLELDLTVVLPNQARHFPAIDPRLLSSVGHIESGAIESSAETGFLVFGPYQQLPAGNWRAILRGMFVPEEGILRADVAARCGMDILASCVVNQVSDTLNLQFTLSSAIDDLEVRVWVNEAPTVCIKSISLEPVGLNSDFVYVAANLSSL